MKQGCVFCNIANGNFESATLFENSEFRVILDKFPGNEGHTLILTKEHFDNIFDLDAETAGRLFGLATVVAKALKKELNLEGLNVVQNNGRIAGQTVDHFHLHLIPRYKDDHLKLTWPSNESSDEALNDLAERLAKEI